MSAVWMRLRSEIRTRWRSWLGLALLIGLTGGAAVAAAAGARRVQILIQAVHDQQQVTVFGVDALGGALPQRPELMELRDRRVLLQQVGQLRDHRSQKPRAVRVSLPPRQEIAGNLALAL